MAFFLDPSMYYMLNSHNHFSTVGNNQFRHDTAQQFMHSLGYTTATPGHTHYGVPPGHHHHHYDEPPPYSPPGVPPPGTHGSHGFPHTVFGTGQRISLGQLQTNVYNGFMQNLGLDPHQHTPYRPQFAGAGGVQTPGPNTYANLADLQTNVYNGFMQNFRAHTQEVGLSDASWYGSGGWTSAWHMPYPHFAPQPVYTHRYA